VITIDHGPELPTSLTPVTLLSFLKKIRTRDDLSEEHKSQLGKTITELQTRSFAAESKPPNFDELQEIALRWQKHVTMI